MKALLNSFCLSAHIVVFHPQKRQNSLKKPESKRFDSFLSAPSGSAKYHYENKTFTGDMVDLSVAAVLVDEQTQTKETVRCDFLIH